MTSLIYNGQGNREVRLLVIYDWKIMVEIICGTCMVLSRAVGSEVLTAEHQDADVD